MRLIDADAAIKNCEEEFDGVCVYDVSQSEVVNDFTSIIDMTPTVDAVPVRYGRWIGSGENVYCSECRNHPLKDMDKDSVYYWRYQPNYCPNCGAKMMDLGGDKHGNNKRNANK